MARERTTLRVVPASRISAIRRDGRPSQRNQLGLPEIVLRGYRIVVSLAWAVLVASPSTARASVPLQVRPVLHPQELARLAERDARGRAAIRPEVLQGLEVRAKRWRSFRDDITAPGFNRSPYAALRRGAPRVPRARLRAGQGEALGPGFPRTLRLAFVRIDFQADRGGNKSTGDGRFDLSGPDTLIPPIDRPPHNRAFFQAHLTALSRYYDVQSYGLVKIEGEVWPREQNGAYSLSDMADLGPWKFSQDIYPAALHMFRTMLFAADSQSRARGDTIPWANYDRIVLIHAGSDLQSDVRQDTPEDIPSFTIGVSDSDAVPVVISPGDTLRIDRAAVVPESASQDGYYGAINGVLAHECGHLMFGFVDVYDVSTGYPVVGFWSLMDSGPNVGSVVKLPHGDEIFATGFLPPSIDPWQRFRFMLEDQFPVPEVVYGDTVKIRNDEHHPELRRVTLSSDEYLMLENRYLAPSDSVQVDQDDSTRVVLGPKKPDRFEYDALLPGGGILVWHVDESVFPLEFAFPIDTALRVNPDYGLNTDPNRRGLSIIEADALGDLGDPGSPYLLGAPFDPYFRSNNPTLSDTTAPNLIPHIRTRPHIRLDFLDDPDSTMRVVAARVWQLAGWPIRADFPPGGPSLLAVDADGAPDHHLEVCWAGGADTIVVSGIREGNPNSNALFAVRTDGRGIAGPSHAFARLDRKPRPVMAALPRGEPGGGGAPPDGPSCFAVSTYPSGPDTSSPGGRVWLIDGDSTHLGRPLPGWPARLPSIVTTPPVIAQRTVYVGCADGRVYALALDGSILGSTDVALRGGVTGRLAVFTRILRTGSSAPNGVLGGLIAAGGAEGEVAVFNGFQAISGWPRTIGPTGFDPEFLWLDFGGALNQNTDCFRGTLTLVVHHADRLWAFCPSGEALPGWGRDVGDTLVNGLGAGDPDGDGYPEVLTQSVTSQVAFWNLTGYPSPGWPRRGTPEGFRTASPTMAMDLDGDGRDEVVAMNASGIIAALTLSGKAPAGWPLSSGVGAAGDPVAADLDRDSSTVEVVAPDRFGSLYGYSVPVPAAPRRAIEWTMLGGDPGRTSALVLDPGMIPPAPGPSPGPLVHGSFKVYPNPARLRPVSFAYQLTEPAEVEFRILDSSGHEVASFSRRGRLADNLEVWDPAGLPAGLYVARVRFHGTGTERTEVIPLGVLR